MHCQTCDYPLWNLKPGPCPECGTAFKPSDFRFLPGSVRFLCPGCGQEYYGTDEQGMLVPRRFACVKCAAALDVDGMTVAPLHGDPAGDRSRAVSMPWIERGRHGMLGAWLRTVGMALAQPRELMRVMPANAVAWEATAFVAMTALLIGLVAMSPYLLFVLMSPVQAGMVFVAAVGASVVVTLLGCAVWAGVVQAVLSVSGPTRGGYGLTYNALAYSSGANVFSAVPCFGWYLGWIWWVVSATLAVTEAQRVSGVRAAFAVLLLPVLLFVLVVGGYVWLITSVMGTARTAVQQARTAIVMSEGAALAWELLDFRAEAGDWPAHSAELMLDGRISPQQFTARPTQTRVHHVHIGGVMILDLYASRTAVREEAMALPDGVVAHRVGDFVFTYHGVDPEAEGAESLWLVVMLPDPGVNTIGPGDVVVAADVSGGSVEFAWSELGERLGTQNALRAELGLPPLPRLDEVTQDSPALGPGP